MDEIYRMLGGEHEADLELEAQKRQRAAELKGASRGSAAAVPNVVRRRKRLRVALARLVGRAGVAARVELKEER
jgi:hypothetical protein